MTSAPAAPAQLPVDHALSLVPNLEAAAELLRALGFTLTEPGAHPGRGTANRLVMFSDTYWELLAIEADTAPSRELAAVRDGYGILGLALRSADAAGDAARLARHGYGAAVPAPVTRPVPSLAAVAAFHTARIDTPETLAAYIFLCEHLTPELVWHPRWTGHPNGGGSLRAVVVDDTPDRSSTAWLAGLDRLLQRDKSRCALRAHDARSARPGLAGLVLAVERFDEVQAAARRRGVATSASANRFDIRTPLLGDAIISFERQ